MRDIPESEARAILSNQLDCIDIGDWKVSNRSAHIFQVECGLLDNSVFKNLHLEITYSFRPDIKVTHMIFSVFKKMPHGVERVFQLDMNNNPKSAKNIHSLPHCHWGDKRVNGDKTWLSWSFEDALTYFSAETKIQFEPKPFLPEFKLL